MKRLYSFLGRLLSLSRREYCLLVVLCLMGISAYPQFPPGYPPQPPQQHQHTWVANGAPFVPVFITNSYPRCGEVIEIGWSSPGIKDMDQCSTCGLYQEEGAHLVSASDNGAGGVFGHFENGEFKEGWDNYPTAYKCPDTPQVVTLSFTVDDDGTLADDPPNTREIKITVWDFTITDCPSDWMPEFSKTLSFHLEIKPEVDHNGNSLASQIICQLFSSDEPEVCKNMRLVDLTGNPDASWQCYWDLQFPEIQSDFDIFSSNVNEQNPPGPNNPPKRNIAISAKAVTNTTLYVVCYDYGAFGTLSAVAFIPPLNKNVVARVKGKPDKTIVRIPVDEDFDDIADCWEPPSLLTAPEDDNDAYPQSNYSGDGISRYDEYRGFFVFDYDPGSGQIGAQHIRTNPEEKDVFVYDYNGLGMGYFPKLGLKIHQNPWMDGSTYKITCFDKSHHITNQYAILLVKDPTWPTDPNDPKITWLGETCGSLNSPGTKSIIYTGRIEFWAEQYYPDNPGVYAELTTKIAIAHELGHAVNLPHCSKNACIMKAVHDWVSFPDYYCADEVSTYLKLKK